MPYGRKNGEGVLFPQGRKYSDKSPDLKGELLIDGKTYELSAWQNQSSNGRTYYAVKARLPGGITQDQWQRKQEQEKRDRIAWDASRERSNVIRPAWREVNTPSQKPRRHPAPEVTETTEELTNRLREERGLKPRC